MHGPLLLLVMLEETCSKMTRVGMVSGESFPTFCLQLIDPARGTVTFIPFQRPCACL